MIYLNWNLFKTNRMATVLMSPVRLPHVSLVRITNRAALNEFRRLRSLHAHIYITTAAVSLQMLYISLKCYSDHLH